jgi:hypothetical protein
VGILRPADDRRTKNRLPVHLLPNLGTVRVAAEQVVVINASSDGLLIESGRRLRPGTEKTVEFVRDDERLRMRGRVVRCELKSISPEGPRYQAAIALSSSIDMLAAQGVAEAAFGVDDLAVQEADADPEFAINSW